MKDNLYVKDDKLIHMLDWLNLEELIKLVQEFVPKVNLVQMRNHFIELLLNSIESQTQTELLFERAEFLFRFKVQEIADLRHESMIRIHLRKDREETLKKEKKDE